MRPLQNTENSKCVRVLNPTTIELTPPEVPVADIMYFYFRSDVMIAVAVFLTGISRLASWHGICKTGTNLGFKRCRRIYIFKYSYRCFYFDVDTVHIFVCVRRICQPKDCIQAFCVSTGGRFNKGQKW